MMSDNLYVNSGDAYLDGGELGDRRLEVQVRNPAGAAIDLTGVELTFMVKRHRADDDDAALITKVTPTTVELDADQTTTGKGKARVAVAAADTAALSGRFHWELQGVDSVGPVTLAAGVFYVQADLIESD